MAIDSFIAQGNAQLASGAKANAVADASPKSRVAPAVPNYGIVTGTNPDKTAGKTKSQVANQQVSPTVISDANIRDNVIPNTQAKAAQMLDTGSNPLYAKPGETQQAYQARVAQIQNPNGQNQQDGTDPQSDAGSPTNDYDSLYSSVMGQTPDKDNFYDAELNLIKQMQGTSDSRTANQLAGVSAQFDLRRNDTMAAQERASAAGNTALMKAGSRYAPQSAAQIMNVQQRGYIRQMSDIDLQEQSAKSEALAAQQDNDYKLLGQSLQVLGDKRKEKLDVVNKLYDSIAEEKKQNQKDVNTILGDAAQAGAPKSVQDQIAAAQDMGSAISAAGGYLQQSSDPQTQRFLEYRNAATAAGVVPLDMDTWKAKDDQKTANLEYSKSYASAKGAAQGKADVDASTSGSGSSTSVSNPAVQAALSTILGSGKFTAAQTAQITASINNGEDPFTTIKNNAKNIMGQTEATKLTSYEAADNAMKDLQSNLQAFYDGGGDTGLISGNLEKANNRLFGATGDPKKVELATQVAISLQAYRNAISGTAYSEQEGQDIASVFPGINKSQGLNKAVISGRLKADQSLIDGIYKTALGDKTYTALKTAEQAANNPVVQQQQEEAADVTTKIDGLQGTNPTLYDAAVGMWASINPDTGLPYTADDLYSAFPELK